MSSEKQDVSSLPLVPEAVLKRKHDMDEMKLRREAQEPRGNRKVFSGRKRIKVKKPETFIAQGRMKRHHEARYKRVLKKGMQKRASNKQEIRTKTLELDGETKHVSYASNSVGAKVVFAVRVRDNCGAPKVVFKALSQLRLRHVHEVSACPCFV